ncbi:SMI1/KNR4 family protein [Endozoicomonadaceae bacterium StTr2]
MRDIRLNRIKSRDIEFKEESLLNFLNRLGVDLPSDYLSFLKKYNGGQPEKNSIRFSGRELGVSGASINYLYGIEGYSENIAKTYDNIKYDIPELLVPIANTPGGDFFLMSLRYDNSYGKIYFKDHEYDSDGDFDEEREMYPEGVVKVCDGFGELLDKLE